MFRDSKERQNPFHAKAIVAGVAAAIGTGGAGLAWSAELEEVVVTARQRAESSQDIPYKPQHLDRTQLSFVASVMVADFWSTQRLRSI